MEEKETGKHDWSGEQGPQGPCFTIGMVGDGKQGPECRTLQGLCAKVLEYMIEHPELTDTIVISRAGISFQKK